MSVVAVQDLCVRYGPIDAVEHITFSVGAGEVVAVVGANGAGKTSTVNAIVGILRPASGRVRVFGEDPWTERASVARRWGVMPQVGGLPMGLRVGECVALFAELYRRSGDVEVVLDECALGEIRDRRWRSLSGGQQQRLSLAIALVGGRDLLVLDEPTASMDLDGQQRVVDLVAARAGAGAAVLITSHRFDEVERLADRVVVLHEGRIRADSPISLLTREVPEVRIDGVDVERLASLNSALGLGFAVQLGGSAASRVPDGQNPQSVLRAVLDWCAAEGITISAASAGRRSLADAYRELLSE